jgi:heptosyltransferase-2
MSDEAKNSLPKNILIVQPSWVGDAVMATPMLRAVRNHYPNAKITYLMRRYVKPVYAGMPWANRLITYRTGKQKTGSRDGAFRLGRLLKSAKFDLAILLPGSFKSALICKLASIPRIVGYDRDGRGMLLTDKLLPLRYQGQYVPTPIVNYYLSLARYLGAGDRDTTMQLFVTEAEKREAIEVLTRAGLDPDREPRRVEPAPPHPETGGAGPTLQDSIETPSRRSGKPPLVILNPGAQYGAAKCWLPEYFAAVADRLKDELDATVIVSSAPRERKIVDEIAKHAKRPFIDLGKIGPSLGALKEIIRRADLMITNDTGPRHIAAAFGVPVVTVFGPTHPEWTEIYFALERKVAIKVFCGPCQLKTCPLDHRCMKGVTPDMVYATATELLR